MAGFGREPADSGCADEADRQPAAWGNDRFKGTMCLEGPAFGTVGLNEHIIGQLLQLFKRNPAGCGQLPGWKRCAEAGDPVLRNRAPEPVPDETAPGITGG